MKSEFASIFELGRAERLQLVEDLWDGIAQKDTSNLPVPDWKRDELRQRKARFLQHPRGRAKLGRGPARCSIPADG